MGSQKDYGRRPAIRNAQKNEAYPELMKKKMERAELNVRRFPHSEFKKPYLTDDYEDMERTYSPRGVRFQGDDIDLNIEPGDNSRRPHTYPSSGLPDIDICSMKIEVDDPKVTLGDDMFFYGSSLGGQFGNYATERSLKNPKGAFVTAANIPSAFCDDLCSEGDSGHLGLKAYFGPTPHVWELLASSPGVGLGEGVVGSPPIEYDQGFLVAPVLGTQSMVTINTLSFPCYDDAGENIYATVQVTDAKGCVAIFGMMLGCGEEICTSGTVTIVDEDGTPATDTIVQDGTNDYKTSGSVGVVTWAVDSYDGVSGGADVPTISGAGVLSANDACGVITISATDSCGNSDTQGVRVTDSGGWTDVSPACEPNHAGSLCIIGGNPALYNGRYKLSTSRLTSVLSRAIVNGCNNPGCGTSGDCDCHKCDPFDDSCNDCGCNNPPNHNCDDGYCGEITYGFVINRTSGGSCSGTAYPCSWNTGRISEWGCP